MELQEDAVSLVKGSALYRQCRAELDEVSRHRWIESETAGRDIGFERALLDWIVRHRRSWRESRLLESKASA